MVVLVSSDDDVMSAQCAIIFHTFENLKTSDSPLIAIFLTFVQVNERVG
jgi:hypothetical protein